jgi:hypothetical protein
MLGHVRSVCRQEKPRCGMYGKDVNEGDFKCLVEENGQGAKCCNCVGEHEAQSLECPCRVKETEVAKIRAVESLLCGGCQKGRKSEYI